MTLNSDEYKNNDNLFNKLFIIVSESGLMHTKINDRAKRFLDLYQIIKKTAVLGNIEIS